MVLPKPSVPPPEYALNGNIEILGQRNFQGSLILASRFLS